jgi:hypothetical protein
MHTDTAAVGFSTVCTINNTCINNMSIYLRTIRVRT